MTKTSQELEALSEYLYELIYCTKSVSAATSKYKFFEILDTQIQDLKVIIPEELQRIVESELSAGSDTLLEFHAFRLYRNLPDSASMIKPFVYDAALNAVQDYMETVSAEFESKDLLHSLVSMKKVQQEVLHDARHNFVTGGR